jgi:hypothetical protein
LNLSMKCWNSPFNAQSFTPYPLFQLVSAK